MVTISQPRPVTAGGARPGQEWDAMIARTRYSAWSLDHLRPGQATANTARCDRPDAKGRPTTPSTQGRPLLRWPKGHSGRRHPNPAGTAADSIAAPPPQTDRPAPPRDRKASPPPKSDRPAHRRAERRPQNESQPAAGAQPPPPKPIGRRRRNCGGQRAAHHLGLTRHAAVGSQRAAAAAPPATATAGPAQREEGRKERKAAR